MMYDVAFAGGGDMAKNFEVKRTTRGVLQVAERLRAAGFGIIVERVPTDADARGNTRPEEPRERRDDEKK
jgi:hypothetical protein